MTVAQFVEEALEEALNKLEKQRGEPFPKRKAELRPGRPTRLMLNQVLDRFLPKCNTRL